MVEKKSESKDSGPVIKTKKLESNYFLDTLKSRILKEIHQKKSSDSPVTNLTIFHNECTQIMNNKDVILAHLRSYGLKGTLGRYEDGTVYYHE